MLRAFVKTALFGLLLIAAACEAPGECDEEKGNCVEKDSLGGVFIPENLADMPFNPSNIDLAALAYTSLEDIVFEESGCANHAEINTDDCTVSCIEVPEGVCTVAAQQDGSEVAVLTAKRFEVDGNVVVDLKGQRPLIVLATAEMFINGTLVALDRIYERRGVLGGYSSTFTPDPADGGGPGGGEKGEDTNGAGGGAYCGNGGQGGVDVESLYPFGAGGFPYGNAEIIPLQGGSAGGKGEQQSGGAGGGALQLVSAVSIEIGRNGGVHMPGNGGESNSGNGGGSGGAVLLEAPAITMRGAVTANGGGGGAGNLHDDGAPGSFDDTPAYGGRDDEIANGGDGSAALSINGLAGEDYTRSWSAGGGGGGAGRIRFNTSDGTIDNTGIVSPSLDSSCASIGTRY